MLVNLTNLLVPLSGAGKGTAGLPTGEGAPALDFRTLMDSSALANVLATVQPAAATKASSDTAAAIVVPGLAGGDVMPDGSDAESAVGTAVQAKDGVPSPSKGVMPSTPDIPVTPAAPVRVAAHMVPPSAPEPENVGATAMREGLAQTAQAVAAKAVHPATILGREAPVAGGNTASIADTSGGVGVTARTPASAPTRKQENHALAEAAALASGTAPTEVAPVPKSITKAETDKNDKPATEPDLVANDDPAQPANLGNAHPLAHPVSPVVSEQATPAAPAVASQTMTERAQAREQVKTESPKHGTPNSHAPLAAETKSTKPASSDPDVKVGTGTDLLVAAAPPPSATNSTRASKTADERDNVAVAAEVVSASRPSDDFAAAPVITPLATAAAPEASSAGKSNAAPVPVSLQNPPATARNTSYGQSSDPAALVPSSATPATRATVQMPQESPEIGSPASAPTTAVAPTAPTTVAVDPAATARPAPGTVTINWQGRQASDALPAAPSALTLLRAAMKPSASGPETATAAMPAGDIMPEALSLLRMVTGQSDLAIPDSAAVPSLAVSDTGTGITATTLVSTPVPVSPMAQPLPQPLIQIVQPPVQADLSASIDQQVIDMTVEGQWIDRMAEEIVQIASDTGRSTFRLSPQALGAMQVDIFRTDKGADVRLMVQTDAAEAALHDGRHRLETDARLAGARINDVTIVRAPENQESTRNQNSTNTNAQQQNSQNPGQNGLSGGQGQGNNPGSQAFRKPAVIEPGRSTAEQPDTGAPRARYA